MRRETKRGGPSPPVAEAEKINSILPAPPKKNSSNGGGSSRSSGWRSFRLPCAVRVSETVKVGSESLRSRALLFFSLVFVKGPPQ